MASFVSQPKFGFYQDSDGWIVDITDELGAADSRALGVGPAVTDALALTHAAPTQASAAQRSHTDALNPVDSRSQVGNIGDTRTDTSSPDDLATQVAAYLRTTTGRVLIPF